MVSFRPTHSGSPDATAAGSAMSSALTRSSAGVAARHREGPTTHQQQNEEWREIARKPQRRPGKLQGCSPSRMSHEDNMLGRAAARQVTPAHNSVIPSRLPGLDRGTVLGVRSAPPSDSRPKEGICQLGGQGDQACLALAPQGHIFLLHLPNFSAILLIYRDILRSGRKQFYLQPSARALFRTVSTPPPPVRTAAGYLSHGWHITAGA